jgi:hypothetical protein
MAKMPRIALFAILATCGKVGLCLSAMFIIIAIVVEITTTSAFKRDTNQPFITLRFTMKMIHDITLITLFCVPKRNTTAYNIVMVAVHKELPARRIRATVIITVAIINIMFFWACSDWPRHISVLGQG